MLSPFVDELRAKMSLVEPYPKGVVAVPAELPFTAFFPGGRGLWSGENNEAAGDPRGEIMIVGHNFYNVAGYELMRTRGKRDTNTATWRNLLKTLRRNEIALERCFFTNAYMGLMETVSAQGTFPGARDLGFVDRCRAFFREQLALIRPKLIVTLGAHVPPFLAPMSPQLESAWRDERGKPRGVMQIDEAQTALVNATFPDVDGKSHSAHVLPLTHPAQQWPNVRRRRYKNLESYDAEDALLRDGMKCAFGAN